MTEEQNPNVGAPVIERPPVTAPVKGEEPQKPPMYAVILHNDPSTHFHFVAHVLSEVFAVPLQEAAELTRKVHREGRGLVRVYSKEIAEAKVDKAMQMAASSKDGNGYFSGAPCELTFTSEPQTDAS